ncbi:unnamed protein product, partial [marine sediment metagenome]
LVIKDDTYTYLIAPRVTEDDIDYDDVRDVKEKKDDFDSTIRISQVKYKGLMKAQKKAEMVEEYEALELKYDGHKSYDAKRKDKHEVLYDLLKKRKDVKGRETHAEKEVKDIKENQSKNLEEQEFRVSSVMATIEDEMSTTKKATKRYKELSKTYQELQEQKSEIKKEREEIEHKEKQKDLKEKHDKLNNILYLLLYLGLIFFSFY